jgi:hypothetical protein
MVETHRVVPILAYDVDGNLIHPQLLQDAERRTSPSRLSPYTLVNCAQARRNFSCLLLYGRRCPHQGTKRTNNRCYYHQTKNCGAN